VSSPEILPLTDHELAIWMLRARDRLVDMYPTDSFMYVQDRGQTKIRCFDCPDRTFMVGPGSTLNNFEAHMRTPKHRSNVNERLSRETNTLFT
jgi:SWI/SNF-related matrix-associated actin-dependent regulator of chromatin subfamily B protein 1